MDGHRVTVNFAHAGKQLIDDRVVGLELVAEDDHGPGGRG